MLLRRSVVLVHACVHAFFKYGCSYVEGGNINIYVLPSLLLDGIYIVGYSVFLWGNSFNGSENTMVIPQR